MENEQSDLEVIYRLLDDNIKRSNKIGDFICENVLDLSYWEIRYTLPRKIMEGHDAICEHFTKKKVDLAEKISFYFWLKDELQEVAKMEREHLTVRKMKKSTSYRPSPRSSEYYYLMELKTLSGGCPIKAEKIKKMKYGVIFETLLANAIENEGEWIQ